MLTVLFKADNANSATLETTSNVIVSIVHVDTLSLKVKIILLQIPVTDNNKLVCGWMQMFC